MTKSQNRKDALSAILDTAKGYTRDFRKSDYTDDSWAAMAGVLRSWRARLSGPVVARTFRSSAFAFAPSGVEGSASPGRPAMASP